MNDLKKRESSVELLLLFFITVPLDIISGCYCHNLYRVM